MHGIGYLLMAALLIAACSRPPSLVKIMHGEIAVASMCLHMFFLLTALRNESPGSPEVFDRLSARQLAAVQFVPVIPLFMVMAWSPPASRVFMVFALAAVASQVWGAILWLGRRSHPEETLGSRLFENLLYGTHCLVMLAAFLMFLRAPAERLISSTG